MRHLKSGRRLGRTSSHRKAMLRNMVTSLLEHGYVHTTDEKAKELRPVIDGMITLGKKNTLHARRLAARTIRSRAVLTKLFDEVAPGFTERHGGYTRIIKLGTRAGDNASMSRMELMPAGAPEPRKGARPAAPRVKPSVSMPETKERFDVEEDEG
ncbi:MAG: 50S ribosomal protein L17 [Deltaproteobacteria bacterium]|nr:50S ribosomal protein L17 [Deltaproteobacteria bacterium]MCB9787342.1 50S ribosomal protein L17 [Deltaproteobacteria bacterium]